MEGSAKGPDGWFKLAQANVYYDHPYDAPMDHALVIDFVKDPDPSSSPLLALRLLREVGHRYRPDLVVLALDMTDFHDDLRYERQLRRQGDFEPDSSEIVARFVERAFPGLGRAQLRGLAELVRAPRDAEPRIVDLPEGRYFATEAPLAETRAAIERGVMHNLAELHAFSRDVLDAPLAVFVYPRAFQYSDRESTDNWEQERSTRLGPFAREPFRYFEEVGGTLAYPLISLLPVFERSEEFPLFRSDDPHWNEAGARLAAESIAAELSARGLLPCTAPR